MSSPTLHLEGIVPAGAKYKAMREVYYACERAGVEIPIEVTEFFDNTEPDEFGFTMELDDIINEYSRDSEEGIEIYIDNIPEQVKKLRFKVLY